MKMRKFSAVVICCILIISLIVGIAACADDKQESEEPIVTEPDSYDMSLGEGGLAGKLIDTALSGLRAGVSGGVSSVVSSVSTWVAEGVLQALGFDYMGDATFQSTVLEKLNDISNSLDELSEKIDDLSGQLNDEGYKNQYSKFQDAFHRLKTLVAGPYNTLTTLEQNIEEGTAVNAQQQITDLSYSVNPSGNPLSDMDALLSEFAYSVLGSTNSSVAALEKYNIFETVYQFIAREHVYLESMRSAFEGVISDAILTYFAGVELATINYSMTLGGEGIEEIWLGPVMNAPESSTAVAIIGYSVSEGEDGSDGAAVKTYRNCQQSAMQAYSDYYGDLIADTDLENAEAQTLNNVSAGANTVGTYFAAMISKYNQIKKLYDDFMSQKKFDSVKTDSQTRTWGVSGSSLSQRAGVTVKSLWAKDFLSVSEISGSGDISVNYGAFGNISKADFTTFATDIYNALKDDNITFRQLFEREGFVFPANNKSSYLILGAEKGISDYDDYSNNGYKYKNAVAICCVDLDSKIKDFVQNNSFVRITYTLYCSKKSVNSSCGPKFEEVWYLAEGVSAEKGIAYARSVRYMTKNASTWAAEASWKSPVKYYTISGLSSSPKSGTVKRAELSF